MSDPPPDARESALDLLIRWADTCYDPNGVRIYEDAEIDRARAELSALRASQGAVAREFVEAADRLRGAAQDPEHSCAPPWGRVIAYDRARLALRPTATGEAGKAALADEMAEALRDSRGDATDGTDWNEWRDELLARYDAAIARAEGRKEL